MASVWYVAVICTAGATDLYIFYDKIMFRFYLFCIKLRFLKLRLYLNVCTYLTKTINQRITAQLKLHGVNIVISYEMYFKNLHFECLRMPLFLFLNDPWSQRTSCNEDLMTYYATMQCAFQHCYECKVFNVSSCTSLLFFNIKRSSPWVYDRIYLIMYSFLISKSQSTWKTNVFHI